VLFVLSVEQTSDQGETQAAVQRSLGARERSLKGSAEQQRALLESQRAALARRAADMRRELSAMDGQAALQREQLALGEQALARLQSLRGENFVSDAQVQAKKEDVLGLRAKLKALELARSVQQREIAALDAEQHELPLKAAARQGEIERDLAELAQVHAESQARRRVVIAAPTDGVVGAVVAEPGQTVSPAVALATLLPPDARLRAHLYAPSSTVGFLRPQQPVLLRYQAFPYQKFGHQKGEVLQVSRTPLAPGELGLAPSAEPMYRVTVALERQAVVAYGQAQPLVAGMQLEADVLLDRRRLIEWIFEPVLGLSGRV
jgi:membrane fusion protein